MKELSKSSQNVVFNPKKAICLVALASPAAEEAYQKGLKGLEQIGLKYFPGFDPCLTIESQGHRFPGFSDKNRAEYLSDIILDKKIDLILSVRGGAGSTGILEHLNFTALMDGNSALVGFSDITAILINLYQKTNVCCIHGPMLAVSFSKLNDPTDEVRCQASASVESLMKILNNEKADFFNNLELHPLQNCDKKISGKLSGGNLTVLASLCGTPWQADFSEHIVLLEDIGEHPYKVKRNLQQLKYANSLKDCKAIVFGQISTVDGELFPDILKSICSDLFPELPILFGAPFGHSEPNYAFKYGAEAVIENNKITLI